MTTLVDRILIKLGLLQSSEVIQPAIRQATRFPRMDELKNIPRYPPYMEGLPVCDADELLGTQEELTKKIKQLIANNEVLEAHYYPAMQKLASFVQLLPASQAHHHRGAGGMLRHSIEVALWSVQQTEGKLIRNVVTPQQRRLIEPRWRLAVFLAGLCHDLGKAVTDLTVTDRAKDCTWEPYNEGLFDWAKNNGIDHYFLHWQEGRGKNHTHVSSTLLDVIVSKQSLRWLSQGGTDIVIWLTEAINNNPGATNQVHDFMVRADQLSVERDLKSMGVAMAGYEIGVPIERYLTDIMRRLVREGVWRVNEPSARVWNINGATYLVWPMAGEEVARRVMDEDIPGLPKTPDGILDMMVEREIAFLREGEGDPYFYIAPEVLTEKIPDIKLRSIRLRDQALISTMPIASVPGRIIQPNKEVASASPASKNTNQANINFDAAEIGNDSVAETKTQLQHVPSAPDNQSQPIQAASEQHQHVSSADMPEQPTITEQIQNAHSTPEPEPDLKVEQLKGSMGELIRVLLTDLATGKKDAATLLMRTTTRQVCCRWPDTFAGYGFTPKQILDGLTEQGWMEAASEVAKVGDARICQRHCQGYQTH